MERLRPFALAAPLRFAAALAEAVNEITRRAPAPKDLPFFALDHPRGGSPALLERLSELGIFRFYEHVLDFGAGLAGPARWLARHRGCRVTAIEPDPALARAAQLLVRRAHLEPAVTVGAATLEALAVESGSFTHAWSVESLRREPRKAAVLSEVFRALRPGGYVAIQDWVVGRGHGGPQSAYHEPVEVYGEGLRRAGFAGVRVEPAEDVPESDSAIIESLRTRVAELLLDGGMPEEGARIRSAEATLDEERFAITDGRLGLVQIFAQKPT